MAHYQPHCQQTIFQRWFFERAVPCTKRGLFVYGMQIFPFSCTERGLFVHGISSCCWSTSLKPHLFRETLQNGNKPLFLPHLFRETLQNGNKPPFLPHLFRKTLQNGNKPPILPHLFRESAIFRNKLFYVSTLPCGKHKPKTFRWLLIFFFGRVKTDNRQQKHIKSELFAAYFWGSRLNVSNLTSPAENPACHPEWPPVIPYGPLSFRFVLSFRAKRRNLCEATKESTRLMNAIREGQRAVP